MSRRARRLRSPPQAAVCVTGNPGALPDTGATRVRLRVQADVGHDSYRGPRLCGQRRVALTRHEQGEHDTPAHTGDGEQLLFAYPQRGMPLYRLGDGALPVGARIFQRLEQALHARPHGGGSSGPHPKVLLRAALAFQPILHLVAPPPYLLELADRAGERLPDRERGLGAGSRAGQQQPVGRSSPVRLGCAPRPARERDWDDAPASRAADGPRGRTPARSLRSVRARGRPVPRLRPAAQTAFPLAGPLARSSGAVVCRAMRALRKSAQPSAVWANMPRRTACPACPTATSSVAFATSTPTLIIACSADRPPVRSGISDPR